MLWLMLAISLVSATPSRFDLHCTGTEQNVDGIHDTSETFRIDLQQGRFCQGKCTSTAAIKEVTPGDLILMDGRELQTGLIISIKISRETGRFTWRVTGTVGSLNLDSYSFGSCVPKSFTGFPKAKF